MKDSLNIKSYNYSNEGGQGLAGSGKKYFLLTFGCQMNEHDSEVIAALVEGAGLTAVNSAEEADLIIINTCAVRKKPEDKVASLLGKYAALKKENKDLRIMVGGCMPQQKEAARYLKKRFSHVNLIFGTHALPRLPALIETAFNSNKTVIDIEADYAERDNLPSRRGSGLKAWLPVSYGCNNYCSYCVVPLVRGKERSRPFDEVVSDFEYLVDNGYLEVTLLGQNVNSYGLDLPGTPGFGALLTALDARSDKCRIRFMTSHPKDLSAELMQVFNQAKNVCEHLHLPLQSGSSRILELMNRGYSREDYIKLVQELKSAGPEIALTTDFIVGFPGETEQDFSETLSVIEECRFDNAFSFLYSPRQNTRAFIMEETLSRSEKEKRLRDLNRLQHRISKEINQKLIGNVHEILVEGASKGDSAMYTGRTRTNKLVHFPADQDLSGRFVQIRVKEAKTWNLVGSLAGEVSS